ncbi:MAG: hypothetical protein VYC34_09980 [Planctomycetota bacterium]|nr:hypothetical protein [Planctomycetota bacterium]
MLGELVRPVAAEQLVQKDAQRVNVALDIDGVAADLLGTRILRRHHTKMGSRDRPDMGEFGIEKLRNAEVEKFRFALRRHENVAGLDVPVHDEILMRVVDG